MDQIQLRYSPKYRAYFLLMPNSKTAYIAKKAGFGKHREVGHWFTYDAGKAASVIQYADEPTAKRIKFFGETIKLSHATGHEEFCKSIVLKDPPNGKQYKPYQRVGIHFICNRWFSLVADEQGLGKTIQAIGAWNEIQPKHTLVICPATVKWNWHREFSSWGIRQPTTHVQEGRKGYPLNRCDVTIVNYDVLDHLYSELTDKPWDMVFIDEGHFLKNPQAKRTQAVLGYRQKQGITKGANHVVILTGTPVPNRPIEFWPVLTRLAPEAITPFTKYFDFGRRFCAGYQTAFGWDMNGASNTAELNRRLRSSIMIRRLKSEVLTDLPDKQYQIIPFEVDADTKKIVKAECDLVGLEDLKKTGKPKGVKVGEISELRHKLALAKLKESNNHIFNLLENGVEKLVIFAHHTAVIDSLFDTLAPFLPVKIHGGMTSVSKQRAIDTFQNDPRCRVFIGQIQAAGVGITLTAASNVVFVESSWVPGEIAQAVDRCHRIGQKNSVLAQFLVIRGSLEEYMLRTIVEKQNVINSVIN